MRAAESSYSDEPRLIGSRYPLGDDELATLRGNGVEAGISDLSAPENRYERPRRKLLEVYMPVHTPSGRPLLFETYLRFSDVAASGRKVWLAFLPALFAALLLLWLLQLPIALSLARRLRRAHAEREALLLRALNASDTERRVIAADLHDGVVQDLAGASYALAVAAEKVDGTPANEVARALRTGADATRQSMRQLRSLLVEIYPPNLRDAGLEPALNDLAAKAVARGVAVDVDVADGVRPSDDGGASRLPHRAGGAAQRRRARGRGNVQHRRPCERLGRCARRRRRRAWIRARGARGATGAGTSRARAARRPGGGSRRQPRHRLDSRRGHARDADGARAMIRVLVADDHAVVRDGLEQLVRSADDLEFVGGAGDGGEAVDLGVEREPDVVLMDLSMPGLDGIEATRRLVKRAPGRAGRRAHVVLRPRPDPRRARRRRGRLPAEGRDAGGAPERDPCGRARRVTARAEGGARRSSQAHVEQEQEPLRGREREILALVAAGHPNKIIARRLGISEKTVKSHLTSVYRQIGVTDRVQAALWARDHGITRVVTAES